eukprot:TRINITY_DN27747_c0_g1_i1.p1 TRINITY_DN27747_c0_g1~~TRINITY_DN27747_c0_g1_i1.p1  ORF type:complete len:1014 (-),score=238.95 TRINITY_DN27747_c0_g1_i1:3-2849(-)
MALIPPGSSSGMADMHAAPSSSPCLPSTRKLSDVQSVESPGKKTEDQVKQERIWWSEQTRFEVQKNELSLKQELHKTTAALREQFRQKFEIERSERQQSASALDRSIGRLREDLDALKQQQDLSAPVRAVENNLSQLETTLRLEMDALRCSFEDYQRQHGDDLSVQVAAHQASLEAERARLQTMTVGLREEFIALEDRISQDLSRHRSSEAETASRGPTASLATVEVSIEAAVADERSLRLKEAEALRDEMRRLAQELAEDRLAQAQGAASAAAKTAGESALAAEMEARLEELQRRLDSEIVSRQTEAAGLSSDLLRERDVRGTELEQVRQEWRVEMTKTAQDIATEMLERRKEFSNFRDTVEELRAGLGSSLPSSTADGGDAMTELKRLLEIESKARKNDVDGLRQQLNLTEAVMAERSQGEDVQSTISQIDMRIDGLANALETEREHRRSDGDRNQAAMGDVMVSLEAEKQLRTTEAEKLRRVLADLVLNISSNLRSVAGEGNAESQRGLANALESLQSALEKDASQDHAPSEAASSTAATPTPQELANFQVKVLALREELLSRVDVVVASIRGDLAAQAAELRGDMAANCAELTANLLKRMEAVAGPQGQQGGGQGNGMGLQSSAAIAGQLSEVVRFMQVIAAGTEHLGEKLCTEAEERRQGEARVAARVSRVERRLAEVGAGQDLDEMEELEQRQRQEEEMLMRQSLQQQSYEHSIDDGSGHQQKVQALRQQSLMNEGLKDSLEQLVSRVNRMLKPEDERSNAGRRESSYAPSQNGERGRSQSRNRAGGMGSEGLVPGPLPLYGGGAMISRSGSTACRTPGGHNTPVGDPRHFQAAPAGSPGTGFRDVGSPTKLGSARGAPNVGGGMRASGPISNPARPSMQGQAARPSGYPQQPQVSQQSQQSPPAGLAYRGVGQPPQAAVVQNPQVMQRGVRPAQSFPQVRK